MRKTTFIFTLTLAAIGIVLLVTGCSTLDSMYEKQATAVPGEVIRTNTVLQTNVVLVAAAQTNEVTGEVTPPVFRHEVLPTVTYDYVPPTYVTNLAPRQAVAGAIGLTSALPVPGAGTAGLALGFLYSAYAAIRNRKAAKALVLGIEAGRRFLNETPQGRELDAVIRDKLIEHQEAAVVLNEVGKLVNTYTSDTVS